MPYSQCSYCNFTYDPWHGDPRNGVPPGVPIDDLAGTVCSRCGLQGVRHQPQMNPKYSGLEATYYDHFAGKSGQSFFHSWLEDTSYEEMPTVLELGSGTGRLGMELAAGSAAYCGVDWSPDMLKIARQKGKRIFKDSFEERMRLIEQNVLQLDTGSLYTHVICPDGLLQHFTYMDQHLQLLENIGRHLKDEGMLALDIVIPPGGEQWTAAQRKRVTFNKLVLKHMEGSTSIAKQLFRYSISYETYVDGLAEPKLHIEREYALITPKEAALMLKIAGFTIISVVENYGLSTPWRTALLPGVNEIQRELKIEESLSEVSLQDRNNQLLPFQQDVWVNGGYPFSGIMPVRSPSAPGIITLLAKKLA